MPPAALVVVATRLPIESSRLTVQPCKARIAAVERAVAVQVVVDRAGEGHELEVAEEQPADRRRWTAVTV